MHIGLFLTLYFIALPLFIVADFLWLGFIAKGFYHARLGDLLKDISLPAAVIFYVVFVCGLTFFASYPAAVKNSVLSAASLGALFGFFTYATYDLTNLATLRSWSVEVALVDIAWGAVLGACVASAAVAVRSLWI